MEKASRMLVTPGTTLQENREAVIDMFKVLAGRDPTEAELQELDEAIAEWSQESKK